MKIADKKEALKRKTIRQARTLSGKKGRVLDKSDGLFALIGIGESKIPGGASSKKHEYCK